MAEKDDRRVPDAAEISIGAHRGAARRRDGAWLLEPLQVSYSAEHLGGLGSPSQAAWAVGLEIADPQAAERMAVLWPLAKRAPASKVPRRRAAAQWACQVAREARQQAAERRGQAQHRAWQERELRRPELMERLPGGREQRPVGQRLALRLDQWRQAESVQVLRASQPAQQLPQAPRAEPSLPSPQPTSLPLRRLPFPRVRGSACEQAPRDRHRESSNASSFQ